MVVTCVIVRLFSLRCPVVLMLTFVRFECAAVDLLIAIFGLGLFW